MMVCSRAGKLEHVVHSKHLVIVHASEADLYGARECENFGLVLSRDAMHDK